MLKSMLLMAIAAISAPLGAIASHICAPYIYAAITHVVTIEAGTVTASVVYMACSVFTAVAVVGVVSYIAYVFYKRYTRRDERVLSDTTLVKMFFRAMSFGIDLALVLARGSKKTVIDDAKNNFDYCKSAETRKGASGSRTNNERDPRNKEVNNKDYSGTAWAAKPV
ncbi:MAG: hypothetical protein K5Q00_05650 [Gammaproteobacteria bacterium]|nr:hypothetical protein [Gammaproteobacteria bacterium]